MLLCNICDFPGRGVGGGRNQRNQKKVPTLEELDAELDAYSKEIK